MTWVDLLVLLLVLAFGLRGLTQGFSAQVFGVLGVLGGLWVAGLLFPWLTAQWHDARPVVAYALLRWLVVMLAALTVAGLAHWIGALLRDTVEKTPVGWLDRAGGFLTGLGVGLLVVTFALLGALLLPWPGIVSETAARSWASHRLMSGASRTCARVGRLIPGTEWLGGRFRAAERRTIATRAAASF